MGGGEDEAAAAEAIKTGGEGIFAAAQDLGETHGQPEDIGIAVFADGGGAGPVMRIFRFRVCFHVGTILILLV